MTQVKTLLGNESKITPLQLPHKLRLPFLTSFTRRPLFQSSGISSFSHTKITILCSASKVQGPPSFIASGRMLSTPGALAFFSQVRAVLISPLEIGPVLMFRGMSAGLGSGNWLGGGLFSTDSKCLFPSLKLVFRFHQERSIFASNWAILIALWHLPNTEICKLNVCVYMCAHISKYSA